jgi:signal transduction histidine kinase
MNAAVEPKPVARGLSVRQRLTLIVMAVAVPMMLLSVWTVWQLAERERDISRQAMVYSSRSIMSAVDAQLGKYIAVAQTLAASPSLKTHDLVAFRDEAERALPGLSGAWVLVADPHGQQVLNTLVPAGEALPGAPPEAQAARAFETHQIQVSNVGFGPVAKVPVVGVGVPIFRGTVPNYYVMIVVDVTFFRNLLNHERIPEGWRAAVADRRGNVIARSEDHERWVGQPAGAGWRAIMQQDGVFELPSFDGEPLVHVNAVSPLSEWTIGVATEKRVIEAAIRRTVIIAGLVGLAVTLSSLLLAAWAAQKIAAPIKALAEVAGALKHREPVSLPPTGVPEVDQALQAFETASQELIAHEEQRVKAEAALAHASRLSEIGQMAAALAHELNQPLTAVASYIGGCRRILTSDVNDQERMRKLKDVMERANVQALRAGEIIRRLREFIGTGQRERTIEDAASVLRAASTLAIADAKHHHISIRSDISGAGRIIVDKVQIQQVIVNLVRNAIDAMAACPLKELTIGLGTKDDRIEVSVSDTGSGIAPEIAAQLFKPFTSTKDQGMGIGLSICREIIEAHHGKIWTEPNPGGGTVFRFTLPLVRHDMIA